jgi:hypothetical protein
MSKLEWFLIIGFAVGLAYHFYPSQTIRTGKVAANATMAAGKAGYAEVSNGIK